jgi:hypothetical protein
VQRERGEQRLQRVREGPSLQQQPGPRRAREEEGGADRLEEAVGLAVRARAQLAPHHGDTNYGSCARREAPGSSGRGRGRRQRRAPTSCKRAASTDTRARLSSGVRLYLLTHHIRGASSSAAPSQASGTAESLTSQKGKPEESTAETTERQGGWPGGGGGAGGVG